VHQARRPQVGENPDISGHARRDYARSPVSVVALIQEVTVSDPSTELSSAYTQSRDKLQRDLAQAIDDAEALIRLTAEQTGERIDAARDRAKASLGQAKRELGRIQADALEQSKRAVSTVDDFVRTHPWQALGAAALVGVVVGALIARR